MKLKMAKKLAKWQSAATVSGEKRHGNGENIQCGEAKK